MQQGPMFQRLAFDPDTIRVMGAAFDDVCRARLCSETLAYFGLEQNGGALRVTRVSGSWNSFAANWTKSFRG